MLKSLFRIVTAPLEIALDVTEAIIEPIAEIAQDVVDEIKDLTKGN